MSIHYSSALRTHVAADEFGIVMAIYNPSIYGTLADFRRAVRELMEG